MINYIDILCIRMRIFVIKILRFMVHVAYIFLLIKLIKGIP